ncbi:MAG TPA: UDP-2,3-diacylglucosamine diphosphatase, partial [Pseudoxanthomonas sp.]|nr:UDP-2,3-diacylglucosamine diphosphatase [Pseudoxanthomonas sp.]
LAARLAFAAQARAASMARQKEMKGDDRAQFETITDVTPATVEATFARYGIDTLVHGHTHRPAIHDLNVDGRARQRIVLGDWYEQGSVLRVDAQGMKLASL